MVWPVLLLTSCGFPRPPDVGDDAPGDSGTPIDLAAIIHVAPSGDDANDGHTQPVKTLKQALTLATADTKVTQIALAAGAYSTVSGEVYPYTLPPNVTIVGPGDGGAILLGTRSDVGISIVDGGLHDVLLQDFTTAIIATGTTQLKNVKVSDSTLALQAKNIAKVTINNMDIMSTAGSCAQGIALIEAAQATIDTLTARGLGVVLDSKDQSSADISNASLSGDTKCIVDMLSSASASRFTVRNSVLDGGTAGIGVNPTSAAFQATISDTIVRNMKSDGFGGGFSGPPASMQWIGGEISNNGGSAAQIDVSTWTFTNVKMQNNKGLTIYQQGGTLIMRGCTVTGNGSGIDAFLGAHTDLGTAANPGNNTFQGNQGVGVSVETAFPVTAVGNTWNANVQGADAVGKYPSAMTVNGPVPGADGNNFSISDGEILTR